MNSKRILKDKAIGVLGGIGIAIVLGGALAWVILGTYPPEQYELERLLNGYLPYNPIPTPFEKEKMRKIDSVMLQRLNKP